jgi:DNA repair protein RadC
LCDLPTEECWVLLLNQAFKVIDKVKISSGGLNATAVDVRCVLREALLKRATNIVLCHNHPSGNIRPSRDDDRLTEQLNKACQTMNIGLADHVILVDGRFYSYADEGRII